jgi:hypothetical protein
MKKLNELGVGRFWNAQGKKEEAVSMVRPLYASFDKALNARSRRRSNHASWSI